MLCSVNVMRNVRARLEFRFTALLSSCFYGALFLNMIIIGSFSFLLAHFCLFSLHVFSSPKLHICLSSLHCSSLLHPSSVLPPVHWPHGASLSCCPGCKVLLVQLPTVLTTFSAYISFDQGCLEFRVSLIWNFTFLTNGWLNLSLFISVGLSDWFESKIS